MKYLFSILVITILIVSCSKDNPTAKPVISTDYYPLKIGSWHIYDVDSIFYNNFTTPVTIDSAFYQVMEEITDTFYDLEGSLSYELKRFKRIGNDSINVENAKWNISDVWWVKNNKGNIERIEENKIFVSLIKKNNLHNGIIYLQITRGVQLREHAYKKKLKPIFIGKL